ncbi:stage V sporulation protein E [Candidatus Roizmanbacteria bacterium CG17_big_fil_post_rev_8_21_14_2_50_39_7]|uniref:Probable peptidoglycan glycosyltransferase FtsW n=5 Tax=Candidatus Roizmaniibacteriota TaxID=1752723 RepID=A0A2M7EJ37_9BACT|nr:MAG: stage V sporulation protein E [Candidatus Roizmanbacteria bacterium CG17_big_fil_post_rev_8_21_14_2_50_39_7]
MKKQIIHEPHQTKRNKILTTLITVPFILAISGLFFVFEASYVRAFADYGDSFHYLKVQAMWIILGGCLMFLLSLFDYHKWYYLAFYAMLSSLALLFLVLIPGIGTKVGGARRWIFGFQPSEAAKISTIIYLSSWFLTKERKRFFSFILLLGLLMFLIMLQPDMGTATIIFSISIAVYFLAGVELKYLLFLIPTSVLGFVVLAQVAPYRLKRITAFFDPTVDPLGITYHINQILISLSNGGIFGRGFGASKQKHLYLPEAHTDSIFAIVGEEVGFIGSVLFIGAFVMLILYIFRIAEKAPDRYGRLLAGSIFAFFGIQTLVNLGSMVHVIPLTGVPLPFVSYGGSNLLLCFALMGIILNIARQTRIE